MQKIIIWLLLVPIYACSYNQKYLSTVVQTTKKNNALIASGVDFRGAGSLLVGQKMQGELSGSDFSRNDKEIVPLMGTIKIPGQATDLSNSDFSNSNLISASFKGANAQNTVFNGADICWADFSEANLKGAQFKGAKNISKARFYKATMPDGTLLSYGSWTDQYGSVFNAYASKK